MIPAFADIGTGSALANGVEAEALNQALEVAVILADRRGRAKPLGTFGFRGDGDEH